MSSHAFHVFDNVFLLDAFEAVLVMSLGLGFAVMPGRPFLAVPTIELFVLFAARVLFALDFGKEASGLARGAFGRAIRVVWARLLLFIILRFAILCTSKKQSFSHAERRYLVIF